MHKPDWVGDRKLGYCTVSVTVSRYLCELEGPARGRLRTGHCCRKRQGIYSFAQNSLPACKRLGERVSVKDDRSTRTVNINMVWGVPVTTAITAGSVATGPSTPTSAKSGASKLPTPTKVPSSYSSPRYHRM